MTIGRIAAPTYPLNVPALRVEQPLGVYYVAVLPARVLLDVAYSHAMSAQLDEERGGYTVSGTQRLAQPKRLDQITDYIDRGDSAFPNSIILAANFDPETGFIEDVEEDIDDATTETGKVKPAAPALNRIWTVVERPDGCYVLSIPSASKLAAIIDGQHRLFAFPKADPRRLELQLICAVFLDLPKPFQASLFATINSTQKPVDKSLTYELFGYNISEEAEERWTPDKLAVFLTRKLNTEKGSPLKGKIVVAPKRDAALLALNAGATWRVSTAVIVDGILRLFSSNPKRDTNEMLTPPAKTRQQIRDKFRDRSPLREAYLTTNDAVIYTMVMNYLNACDRVFWQGAQAGSFITKTVGVQALLDVLRHIAAEAYERKDIRVEYFIRRLEPASGIDFSTDAYHNASGSGRSAIRRAIEKVMV